MRNKIIWVLVTVLGVLGSIASIVSYFSSDTGVKQSTEGNASPAIYSKGDVSIIYNSTASGKVGSAIDPIRINYYRMKGAAPDFLIKGILTKEWQQILGGPQEIINNVVLKNTASVLKYFADEPYGGVLYSDNNNPISSDKDYYLTTLAENIGKNPEVFKDGRTHDKLWDVYLGGRQPYDIAIPDLVALDTTLNTYHWPSNYNLYHSGPWNSDKPHYAPVIWRNLEASDLASYENNIRKYYSFILKGISNSQIEYFIHSDMKVLNGLRHITRNGLPEGFMLVEGRPAPHNGWELHTYLRDIELEVCIIENISKEPIEVGLLKYKELIGDKLRTYEDGTLLLDSCPIKQTRIYPARYLLPGEKIIISIKLHFIYPTKIYDMDYGVAHIPSYSHIPGSPHLASIKHINGEHLFYKSKEALKNDKKPQVNRRFDYGPTWKLISIAINKAEIPIREAEWKDFNLYLSNLKGSCPFVYTKSEANSPWISQGHILFGAVSDSLIRSDKLQLPHYPNQVKLRENEAEISFIKDIFIQIYKGNHLIKTIYPYLRYRQINGMDIVARNAPLIYNFETHITGDNERIFLCIEGYYIPFSTSEVQKEVIRKSKIR